MNVYSIELKVIMIQHKYITEYITTHRVSKTEWNFSELAKVITMQHMGQSFVVFHLQQLVSDELMHVQRARRAQVDVVRDNTCYMDTDEVEMDAPCAYFSLALEKFLCKDYDVYSQETYLEIDKTFEIVSRNFWNMSAEEQDRAIEYDARTEMEADVDYFRFCM